MRCLKNCSTFTLVTYYEPNSEISSAGSTMIIRVPWGQNESELPPLQDELFHVYEWSTLVTTVATRCEPDSEISTDSSATNVLWSQNKSEFPSLPHLKLLRSGIRRSRTSILRRKACYKLIFLFLKNLGCDFSFLLLRVSSNFLLKNQWYIVI